MDCKRFSKKYSYWLINAIIQKSQVIQGRKLAAILLNISIKNQN